MEVAMHRGRLVAIASVLLLAGCQGKPVAAPNVAASSPPRSEAAGVGCTGYVEPEDGVIVVAAAPVLGRTPVIASLMVKEGQEVAPGQVLAVLTALPDLTSAVKQAEARVAVAQSRLVQLQAGARTDDVQALQADVARLKTESDAAQRELRRSENLAAKDFVPRVQVDAARLKAEESEKLLEAARHRLAGLTDIRDSDLSVAKAELAAAEADRDRARVEQTNGTIRAPVRARVLRIMARPGEAVGPGGVVTLADTTRMSVVAEVYETDIARVHPGQKAVIRSESLPAAIKGVVERISPQIDSVTLPIEPSAPADQRVYQARIKVDRPELLADRIHSKVSVLIEP